LRLSAGYYLQRNAALPPAQAAAVTAFAAQLPQRLVEHLLLAYIGANAPLAVPALAILGLADDALDPGDASNPLKIPHRQRRLHLDALGQIAQNPATFFSTLYGWGTPAFDGSLLLPRIQNILDAADLPSTLLRPLGQPPVLEALLLRLSVQPDPGDPAAPPGLWMRTRRPATADFTQSTPLGGVCPE